jgi:Rrf2 family protein
MKLSANEEYGIRCLLHIARQGEGGSVTIPEISRAEGISTAYVGKLMRILRRGGLVASSRGKAGGYTLARVPEGIVVGEALAVLGGRIFEVGFCERHSGDEKICTHTIDCSVRSLWRAVQSAVDQVLSKMTLRDLLSNEKETNSWVGELVSVSDNRSKYQPGVSYEV